MADWQARLLRSARRAVLATIRPDGRPRLVPIVFAVDDDEPLLIYSAIDEKPKAVRDPLLLARVRDITARPAVSLLVDNWSEDWTQLAWLRLGGRAHLVEHDDRLRQRALALLRERYPQYAAQRLEQRPLLAIEIDTVTGWRA
jgi:PPOX class probable F420-dependent enzyme